MMAYRASAATAAWLLLTTASAAAPAPYDFALGPNAEGQNCRAQTRFGGDRALRKVDIYCGDWDRPSGSITLFPANRRAEAQAMLAADCQGTATGIAGEGFSSLQQMACKSGRAGELTRYGLLAEHGPWVAAGQAFPADWAPMVKSAAALTGLTQAAALTGSATPPGMREIAAVFPAGPPGQAAAANLELLRRRAYERNSLWDFGGSQTDFAELLRAHDAVAPDDAKGSAEIMAEIALNLSGEGRFAEAADLFVRANAKAREAGDTALAGKIANYRAIDLMNQERYEDALQMALRANAERDGKASALVGGEAIEPVKAAPAATRRRTLVVGLGEMKPEDKAAILSAQALYIAGSASAALGRADAETYLNRALGRLAQVSAPPAWLRAQINEQQARARLARGDARGAAAAAEAGLGVVRASSPRSRTEAHLLLVLGRAQRASGQPDLALATERQGVEIFRAQQVRPGMPVDVAGDHLGGLLDAFNRNRDPAVAAEFFEASSLTWDGAAARSATQLAARLASREAGGEARAYQDAERAYRAALARRERLSGLNDTTPAQLAAADEAVKGAASGLVKAEDGLRARSPRFLELLEPSVKASALSGVLADDEGYVRIVLTRRGSYGVLVTKAGVTPYRIDLTEGQASLLAKRLHDGNLVKRNRLADFDIKAATQLYAALFSPLSAEFAALKRLQIDAGGPLAAVPFAALVTAAPAQTAQQKIEDDQDYRGVSWFGRHMFLAQSVGPAPFVRMRAVIHAPGPVKAAIFGDFTPSPQLVAQRLASARGLSDVCRDEVQKALQRLQALPDTAGEAQRTAALFTGATRMSLGAQFTDRSFLEDPSVTEAGVIMLATHGVLGLSSCFAEPALLASVGDGGDGLIEASELLDRRLQARLVVLSACDTAGGGRADAARTGLSDGGEALSGLARAFLYAGASSVLATQWKVDADASGTEIQAFFAAALKEGRPISEALAQSQTVLLKDAETSHPFYWAPFAIIGDGATTLSSGPLAPAKVAALP